MRPHLRLFTSSGIGLGLVMITIGMWVLNLHGVRYVHALLEDDAIVQTNTFSTASVFAGTRIVQSGVELSTEIGLTLVPLETRVNPAKSFLLFSTSHNSNRASDSLIRGRLRDDGLTVEFGRLTDGFGPITIQWYVVEYFSGVRVQRGETMQTATNIDVTLPSPVASLEQAFVTWSKTATAATVGFGGAVPIVAELTAVNNLQFRAQINNPVHRIWWQVIEFTDPSEIFVQRGNSALVASTTSVDVPLGTGVDLNRAFLLAGYRVSGAGPDIGKRLISGVFLDGNNLRFERDVGEPSDSITEIAWQVIELNDGSVVQHGIENFALGESQRSSSISAVDVERSAAISTVQAAAGQSLGRTACIDEAVLGVSSVTLTVDTTAVTLERENVAGPASVAWTVIEFAP